MAEWHWILRRRDLNHYEKMVLLSVRTEQIGEHPVFLSQEQLAELASISVRQVINVTPGLEERGLLEVERQRGPDGFPRRGLANSYRVVRVQGELFDTNKSRAMSSAVKMPASEYSAGGSADAPARRGDPASGDIACAKPVDSRVEISGASMASMHPVHANGPPRVHPVHAISGSTKPSGKPETRAEVRTDTKPSVQNFESQKRARQVFRRIEAHADERKEEADRQRIDCRNTRIVEEVETLRQDIDRIRSWEQAREVLGEIEKRMDSLRPLTETEYLQWIARQKRELQERYGRREK